MKPTDFSLPWTSVYPSQRSGAVQIDFAMWQGQQRAFNIKWHEDRVYFQLTDGDDSVRATLDSCEESEAYECFQTAMQTKRWGVCFRNSTKIPYGPRLFTTFWWLLDFIYAPDGTGLLREWSSRDWITFAPQQTRGWIFFPELLLPQTGNCHQSHGCCQAAARDARDLLLYRRVSAEEREWLTFQSSTTETKFKNTMQLLWNTGWLKIEDTSSRYSSISLGNSVRHQPEVSLSRGAWRLVNLHWSGSPTLWEWLQSYFWIRGYEWRETGWGKRRFRKLRAREPNLRAFAEPRTAQWSVSFTHSAPPSFHEQLDARLQLRQWLRSRAPVEDIDVWLSV